MKWKTCHTPELPIFIANKTRGCNNYLVILALLFHPYIFKRQSLAKGTFNIQEEEKRSFYDGTLATRTTVLLLV